MCVYICVFYIYMNKKYTYIFYIKIRKKLKIIYPYPTTYFSDDNSNNM